MAAMRYDIREAKAHLSKLIEAPLAGGEVIIARDGRPLVKMMAIARERFKVGGLERRLMGDGPDFLEPMSEEDLAPWEGGA